MRDENRSGPSSRYRRSKNIDHGLGESLSIRRKASISSVLTKWRVRRTFHPFPLPQNPSAVTGRSGVSGTMIEISFIGYARTGRPYRP